jgi:hypothetical protein
MTDPQPPLELTYESAVAEPIGRRPKWVWVVIIAYGLVVAFVLLLPLWMKISSPDDNESLIAGAITAGLVAICGMGLMFTPVRIGQRRQITRGNIWIPILASGFLAGALVFGASIALVECLKLDENWLIPVCCGGGAVWIGWAIVIWLMTRSREPAALALWFHRTLFAGSVAELLVAVPCHVIVRRRGECCGGILTGTGICIGCIVMVLSIGPSVGFLYYRRWQKITGN